MLKNSDYRDLKIALQIFYVAAAYLTTTALLGLNPWIGQDIILSILSFEAERTYSVLVGYSLIVNAIFWGGRPSKAHQWLVVICWPIVTAILYFALKTNLDLSIFSPNKKGLLMLASSGMAIPALISFILRFANIHGKSQDAAFETRFNYLLGLSLVFMGVPLSGLQLTISLHPFTYDLFAMHWDAALGLNITRPLMFFGASIPGFIDLAQLCYSFTPLGFLAVAILHLRKRPEHTASAMLVWVLLTSCAMVAYNFFPITGPTYIFRYPQFFADVLADPRSIPIQMTYSAVAPRNGMPSMHFGWMLAATILWWQSGTKWWSRTIIVVMTVMTAIATLCTGEHYLVDLIVATPFVLAAIAASTITISWKTPARYLTVALGFSTWFIWTLILKNLVGWTQTHIWFGYLVLALTAVVVILQAKWIHSFKSAPKLDLDANSKPVGTNTISVEEKRFERKVAMMFFASGAAALIYQVLFAKKLALVFGSTSTATLTIFATFLSGIALGSLIGGKFAHKLTRPVHTFAMIEGAIAAYGIFSPSLFDLIQTVYVALASGHPADSPMLLVLRIVLGALVLLIPTVLMGITLPLLARVLQAPGQRLGSKIGLLYFVNTAGAASAALLTSYALIPAIGVRSTTIIAALLNLFVALAAIELSKRFNSNETHIVGAQARHGSQLPRPPLIASLVALGVGGMLSLGLGVIYVHMLSIVVGNSIYAFALMLATFLLGLAAGGESARRCLKFVQHQRVHLLAATFFGLSISTALSLWFWNDIPPYFASFADYPFARHFAAREAIRGGICALIMFPPSFFIGGTYVFAMDLLTGDTPNAAVRRFGLGAALNTLGNIAGVLIFGFVFLPMLGGINASKLLAICALGAAVLVLLTCRTKLNKTDYALFSISVICASIAFQAKLDYTVLSSGANVYFAEQPWGKVIDHTESIDGGLTSVAQLPKQELRTLLSNGKFQGNNARLDDMQTQISFALTPLLHQEKRDKALVIGYGTGVTSRVFHDAGFQHLDIAEVSADVINLANKHFSEINNKVTELGRVKLHLTDGRNFLLLSPAATRYDVVSIEIKSISSAGASSLYNREFYQRLKSRLANDGVLQQWMQLHHLSPTDILTIISTLREEFTYVTLYEVGGQGILIASNDVKRSRPIKEAMQQLESGDELNDIRRNFTAKIQEIPNNILIANAEVDEYIKGVGVDRSVWLSTDNNLMLEYSTPKANAASNSYTVESNRKILLKYKKTAN